uniref:Uncharacterized protein n=1 Tax=Salix viminalis TaxID=40686 RepID=A0A6N2KUR4_SALVM
MGKTHAPPAYSFRKIIAGKFCKSGANNFLGSSDLGEALDLTVVHLWETCLPRSCAPPGLVRPSGLDTHG